MRRVVIAVSGLLVCLFLACALSSAEEPSSAVSTMTVPARPESATPVAVSTKTVYQKVAPAKAQPKASPKVIKLLPPQTEIGRPLMTALKYRRTSREFDGRELPAQVLSNLLWAAFGVNRPGTGYRTAPSAVNWQEIDIYVAMPGGLYLYDANTSVLMQVLPADIRALTGKQQFVKDAPLNLIYVADLSKMGRSNDADKNFYSAADTGFISENVYLFCASEGLSTVVRGLFDRDGLSRVMNLRPEQKIILTQTVGYPKK